MSILFAITGWLGLMTLAVTADRKSWREAVLAFSILSLLAVFAGVVHAKLDAICEATPECVAEPRP